MIELFESDIKEENRKSSKGNQLKWKKDNIWYKADYLGYEGLAEYVISRLLTKSSLKMAEFVLYDLEEIKYKTQTFNGVKCTDFLKNKWQVITLERLFQNFTGSSLTSAIYKIKNEEDRLSYIVEQMQRITGLTEFGKYINKIVTIDALFLNEDRHMHNIAVLAGPKGKYDYCPIFDNGGGLLSDTMLEYPMGTELLGLLKSVRAKTLSHDFDTQIDISEQLYGENIKFHYTQNDVNHLLDTVGNYDDEIKERVKEIIFDRMRKYAYLFEKKI